MHLCNQHQRALVFSSRAKKPSKTQHTPYSRTYGKLTTADLAGRRWFLTTVDSTLWNCENAVLALLARSLPLLLRFSYGLVSQQIPWGFSSRWSYLPSLNSSWLTSLFQSSLAKSSHVVLSSKEHSKQSLVLASSERLFGFNSRMLASRVEVQCSGIYQFLIRGLNSKSNVFSLTLY